MPVRSLNSSVFKWPEAKAVDQAARRWAEKIVKKWTDVVRIGYFGSYARGDWGVGSDLDLVVIVERSNRPFEFRSSEWDTLEIPVPTDVFVYTQDEWENMPLQSLFVKNLERVIWII
ncbi:MAG: nucleotidyltransferase domain-containing protein [Deltaproteobacteria bacterium]|nr:nucleotidyltransferase domain-containing protein [Deltaproteobacteria bacterium]